MSSVQSGITAEVLDPAALCARVGDDRAGAVASFVGVVRNHDAGSPVTAIDYSAHPAAGRILDGICRRIGEREGVHAVAAWHRTGRLVVGDAALVVAVAAEHRGQAFTAAGDLVDLVKAELPAWKCQWLPDGSHVWSGIA
ncbi:MAG: molybdenum cofactor biosynthesis protein MoaE [Propionibacteriaceae bacterium]|uniref:MoaE n=1 Tax=Propionibacterium ruminifibrarum TaxID=1962131 RepID=A0A375I2C9_9ACTN|nr:molybdenum cofactor biosynthesis protein MoaE [Propionibacterium ruminifibrarum]MBE6476701.1 molybdenum cofactor biosynthesis protein MoaE [Propionibacteriaceae bacterium]SPF69009.1 MoaE [Propionibacterium ruminifibrarum]